MAWISNEIRFDVECNLFMSALIAMSRHEDMDYWSRDSLKM